MGDVGEVWPLGTKGASQRDGGRIALHDQVHWCNGGHFLGSGSQRLRWYWGMHNHCASPASVSGANSRVKGLGSDDEPAAGSIRPLGTGTDRGLAAFVCL